MAEIGIDAEFYAGLVTCEDRSQVDRQHAWVIDQVDGTDFLFEPAARTKSAMIRPLEDAMATSLGRPTASGKLSGLCHVADDGDRRLPAKRRRSGPTD